MLLSFCMGKIHRATVTKADLNYEGSVSIDSDLVEAAGFFEGQEVRINNLRNGTSWGTYILKAPAGSGEIGLNGPPVHHFKPGDLVIILAYAGVEHAMARDMSPITVFVNDKNRITKVKAKEFK